MGFKQDRIAYQTIVVAELKRILRIWSQTLLPPAITSILYFIIFGRVIGTRVGFMGGYKYVQFIAPGLIMMNIITSSYASAVSAFFGAKFQRHIEEILVSPASNITILLGFMSNGLLRGIIVGIIVSIIALFFYTFTYLLPNYNYTNGAFSIQYFFTGWLNQCYLCKKF